MFVDSHCHINFPDLRARLPELLTRMRENRVTHALCISVTLEDFPSVLEIAEQEPNVYATVGVHPDAEADVEEGRSIEEPTLERLLTLADHPRVVGIGETGLDYYRLGDRTVADMEWQRDRFRTHIRASKQTGKPLVIHTRSSADDTLAIMREEGAEAARGVMHCFTETWYAAIISAFSPAALVRSKSMFLARMSASATSMFFSLSASTSSGVPSRVFRLGSTPCATYFCTSAGRLYSTALRRSSCGVANAAPDNAMVSAPASAIFFIACFKLSRYRIE